MILIHRLLIAAGRSDLILVEKLHIVFKKFYIKVQFMRIGYFVTSERSSSRME